jgi:hypothetical protein
VRIVAPLNEYSIEPQREPQNSNRLSSISLFISNTRRSSRDVDLNGAQDKVFSSSSLPANMGGGSLNSVNFLNSVSSATVYAEAPPNYV